MTRTLIRAKFTDPRDEWDILFIDLLVEEGQVAKGGPFCGWWGAIKSTDLMPFVAKPTADGGYVVDFGSDEDTDQTDRLHNLTLPEGPLRRGSPLSFEYDGETVALEAETLTDMIAGRVID